MGNQSAMDFGVTCWWSMEAIDLAVVAWEPQRSALTAEARALIADEVDYSLHPNIERSPN